MAYCNDKKLLFIHSDKCAGKSMENILFGFTKGSKSDHKNIYDYSLFLPIDDYFKFTIVRNPYDRFVSRYFDVKNRTDPKNWKDKSFESFVDYFYEFFEKSGKETKTWKAQSNIVEAISINNKICIDRILRFENLSEEYYNMLNDLNICKENYSLKHINKSLKDRHYSFFYNKNTREKVEEMYQKDIEYFNFKFEENNQKKDL